MIPFQVSAEDTTNPTGKMRLQTERIGQDGKSNTQVDKKTELENSLPDLFKDETKAVIEEKQKEMGQETDDLKKMLFVTEKVDDITMKETMKTLFASDYTVPKASVD